MAFNFYTSDATTRYKAGALESLIYPRNHILTFRYKDLHVAKEVRGLGIDAKGIVMLPGWRWSASRSALIIFAETNANWKTCQEEFQFYPIRHARVIKMWKRGNVYYVSLRLTSYPIYNASWLREYRKAISNSHAPPTKQVDSTGYGGDFLGISHEALAGPSYRGAEFEDDMAWQWLTDTLVKSPGLAKVLFYRIRGVYRQTGFFKKKREKRIGAHDGNTESFYKLSMGRTYVIKILTNAPHLERNDPSKQPAVEIYSQTKDALVVTPESINVSSSYNEDCIFIACKRILEGAFSPIVLRKKENATDADVPEASLFTHIAAPPFLVLIFALLAGLGALSLSLQPEFIKAFWSARQWNMAPYNELQISEMCKGVGAFLVALAGYVAFRKLPTSK